MQEDTERSSAVAAHEAESGHEDFGHPRGTLAIVIVYGVIFALVWLGLYLFEFLPRGAPTP